MSSIDKRIVEVRFDNAQFEKGVKTTMDTLSGLREALNLDTLTSGIEKISSKFSAFGAIGFSILQNLTNTAMNFGKKIVSGVLDPIVTGGKKRALAIEQAKFMFQGLGMDVEKTMESARKAVEGTAYGLDAAASAAAQFGASGMRAGTKMTGALRGIAGVAAMTGSSYEDVSNIFTKVAGNGRLMGDDLLRLSSRGVNAAATLAKSMGTTEQNVREMVTKGKISFEMFASAMDDAFGEHATKANDTYAGSLANMKTALGRIGAAFAAPSFEKQRDIFNSLTPLIDNIAKAIQPLITAWNELMAVRADKLIAFINSIDLSPLTAAIPWIIRSLRSLLKVVEGVLKPMREAFREIFPASAGDGLVKFIRKFSYFIETLKMGADESEKLKRTFAGVFAVFSILGQIIGGFLRMLGSLFGKVNQSRGGILNFTASVGDFLVKVDAALKKGDLLERFFTGLGKALLAPIVLFRKLVDFIKQAFDNTRKVDTSGIEGAADRVKQRFEPLQNLIRGIVNGIKTLISKLKEVASKFSPIGKGVEGIGDKFKALGNINFNAILDLINMGLLVGLIVMLKKFLAGGFIGKFTGGIVQELKTGFRGIQQAISGVFGGMTKTLGAMQTKLKSEALMKIAIAIALLTASAIALSMVDSVKLTIALGVMAGMFAELVGTLWAFEKVTGGMGVAKMQGLAAAMILLGIAMAVLTSSLIRLSKIDPLALAAGLGAMGGMLTMLVAATNRVTTNTVGLMTAGASMILLATAIRILASAVAVFASMDFGAMMQGLLAVGLILVAVSLFNKFNKAGVGSVASAASLILLGIALRIFATAISAFAAFEPAALIQGLATISAIFTAVAAFSKVSGNGANLLLVAAAMLILSSAMKIFAGVIAELGTLDPMALVQGLGGMGGALLVIAAAMHAMPKNMIVSAAALLIVAAALKTIGDVMVQLGGMGWGEIGAGLTVLAGALLIIAAAMYAMSGALPGAAALILVAAALAVLAPVLIMLGSMAWPEILKGLAALAGVFLVLGIAAIVLAPAVPVILALGIAIGLLGIGLMGIGAAVLLFATGLTMLAALGAAGAAGLTLVIMAILNLIPLAMQKLGEGIAAFAKVIGESGPVFVKAMTTLIMSLLKTIDKVAPKVVKTLLNLVWLLVNTLVVNVPKFVEAGMKLVTGILNGIAKNIGKLIDAATNVITEFLKGIGRNIPKILEAGANLLIDFLNGISTTIDKKAKEIQDAGWRIAESIIKGMVGGLTGGISKVTDAAKNVASGALSGAKKLLGINSPSKEFEKIGKFTAQGFANGLKSGSKEYVQAAWTDMRAGLKDFIKKSDEDIKKHQARLKTLYKDRKKNAKAIKEEEKALKKAQTERKNANAAYKHMEKNLKDERDKLKKLSDEYQKVTEKLKAAQDALKDAKKERDDYSASMKDRFDDFAKIDPTTSLEYFFEETKYQIEQTRKLQDGLKKLAEMGLNDKLYKQLADQGLDALPFIDQLINAGPEAIKEANKLGNTLDSVAIGLGKDTSKQLYQAGVDAAQGLVNGLAKEEAALRKQMEKLANYMVDEIKKKLKMKSPSKVFEEIGEHTDEGLAKGLEKYSDLVKKASEGVGETAIDSLKNVLSNMDKQIPISGKLLSPTITPVLDLSGVKKDAEQIGPMLDQKSVLDTSLAYSRAASTASTYDDVQSRMRSELEKLENVRPNVEFNQYNNSPKALTNGEIYRQTKNQIATAKGVLD